MIPIHLVPGPRMEPDPNRLKNDGSPTPAGPPVKGHHSFDDWDYVGVNWPHYDAEIVISPPTSLRAWGGGGIQHGGHCILKTYPNLPNIRFIHNWRPERPEGLFHMSYWRAQANPALTPRHPHNGYALRFHQGHATLHVILDVAVNGVVTQIMTRDITGRIVLGQWNRYRLSAWDIGPVGAPTGMAFRFDIWEVDRWVTRMEGATSPSRWWNSAVNRFGFFMHVPGIGANWGERIDDTEIWIPAVT